MPLIKTKILNQNLTTIDNQHNRILNNIDDDEKLIPNYIEQKKVTKLLLKNETNIEKKLELQDKIITLNEQINTLKHKKKNYLLNNSKYIFEYFEKKKEIANLNNNKQDMQYFFNNENHEQTDTKNSGITKYLNNITKYIDLNNYYINNYNCTYCKKGELIFNETEGLLICNSCFKTNKYFIENDKPSYREPPKEVCFYAYKRINHLREILAQFQAKETTLIPPVVIESIKNQIKKERIDISELTNKKTKEILKNLQYNKYYEHIPFIKEKLGIKPPIMSQELEEKLCNLFIEIQVPYSKYCPKERVNFLNYYYTIYKLCELLSEKQFLPYFPMLKDREKRMEQDSIWKKICKELNWEFIPTI
jgi:hypothetical protein